MRKQIVIALALSSSFALTACGNDHQGSAKASVAAAKIKVAEAKATGDKKMQASNFDEISAKIEGKRVELRQNGFHAADEQTSEIGVVTAVVDNVRGTPNEKREFAVKTLNEMKELSDALVSAAKDLKDDAKVAQANETKEIIVSALEKAENRDGTTRGLFKRAWETVVSGVKAAPGTTVAVAKAAPGAAMDLVIKTPAAAKGVAQAGLKHAEAYFAPPAFTGKFAEIKAKVDAQVNALNEMGYHDQDDQYSVTQIVADAKNLAKTRSSDELAKIKSILVGIKADLDQLVITANENNDVLQKKTAVYLFDLAKSNIAAVEKAEKKQQKAEFKAKNKPAAPEMSPVDMYSLGNVM